MRETENYHLKKPELDDFSDVESCFSDTMDTIDRELKKAETSRTQDARQWRVQLPLSGWSEGFPYMQTVAVADMKASYSPVWGVENAEVTAERAKKVSNVQLKRIETLDGSIRVECVRRPKIDFFLSGKGM